MWTSTLDLDPRRVLLARLLGRFWRGAYFSSFSPLSVQNLPRQALPSSTWVRVRNRLAGICGSDLHLIYADGDLRIAPAAISSHRRSYPGHEVVGEVIEIGDDVHQLRVGDRVVLQYGSNCVAMGAYPLCRFCAHSEYNLCEHGPLPGPHPVGGGWSEEMLLPAQQLYRLAPNTSDEQAVMIEPTAVALHAVLRRLPEAGERVLIIGAGNIGLLTLQILRLLAPQCEISVLARHPFQVEQATRLGAAHIIYPQDSYIGIQRATGAQLYRGLPGNKVLLGGYDVIYDTIGQRKTLHHALRWAGSRASVVLVGISLHMMHIDLTPLWYHEISLLGSLSHGLELWPPGNASARTTFSIVEEMMERGELHPEQLISHRFALNDYQNALLTAAGKSRSRAIKVVFDYSLMPPSAVPNLRASAQQRRPNTIALTNPAQDAPAPPEFVPLGSRGITSPGTPRRSVPLTPLLADHELSLLELDDEIGQEDDTVKVPTITLPDALAPNATQTPDLPQQPTPSTSAENHDNANGLDNSAAMPRDAHPATENPLSVPSTPIVTEPEQPTPFEHVEKMPTQPVNHTPLASSDDVTTAAHEEYDEASADSAGVELPLPAPAEAEPDSPPPFTTAPAEAITRLDDAPPTVEPMPEMDNAAAPVESTPELEGNDALKAEITANIILPTTSPVDELAEPPTESSSVETETAVQQQDIQEPLLAQNSYAENPPEQDKEPQVDASDATTTMPRPARSRNRKYNRRGS